MRKLGESLCFCTGGGKSERFKATIFATKSAAMASLSSSSVSEENGVLVGEVGGSGFLIHKNLLLTTHVNLPSASAAESSEIRLQNGVVATLVPHRFFITSSVLDLTIVGLDTMGGDSNSPGHCLKTSSKPNLDLGSIVYVLGFTGNKELTIGEGKVAIATDNLIKLSTDGATWSPGSAGFDAQGNLAFMICDPMKLATAPYIKSPSSSPSWKRDREMLFGIPMPVICGWLNQHWEGGVDEHSKPKLALMRLVSGNESWSGHPGASSIITNEVFKASEGEDLSSSSTPNVITASQDKAIVTEPSEMIPLLDMESTDYDPRVSEASIPPQSSMDELPGSDENCAEDIFSKLEGPVSAEVSSSGSVNVIQIEFESSPSPVAGSDAREEKPEMERTNSAETAESSNHASPREGSSQQQSAGRGQRGMNYSQWGVHRYPVARKSSVEKHSSFAQPKKSISQGATSRKSNDVCTPTVSSVMKRNANSEKRPKPANKTRQTAVSSAPRWNL